MEVQKLGVMSMMMLMLVKMIVMICAAGDSLKYSPERTRSVSSLPVKGILETHDDGDDDNGGEIQSNPKSTYPQ